MRRERAITCARQLEDIASYIIGDSLGDDKTEVQRIGHRTLLENEWNDKEGSTQSTRTQSQLTLLLLLVTEQTRIVEAVWRK